MHAVDESWHVWLLEANAEPDLMQTGARLRPLVAGLLEGVCSLFLDDLAREKVGGWRWVGAGRGGCWMRVCLRACVCPCVHASVCVCL